MQRLYNLGITGLSQGVTTKLKRRQGVGCGVWGVGCGEKEGTYHCMSEPY